MISTHDYVSDITDEQKYSCEIARNLFKEVEKLIKALPCHGKRSFSDRCTAIAETHLEIACMYTIKAIAFDGKEVG